MPYGGIWGRLVVRASDFQPASMGSCTEYAGAPHPPMNVTATGFPLAVTRHTGLLQSRSLDACCGCSGKEARTCRDLIFPEQRRQTAVNPDDPVGKRVV